MVVYGWLNAAMDMPPILSVLSCAVAAGALACCVEHVRRRRAERVAAEAIALRDATMRLLRLSAGDQRNVALTLFGHARAACPSQTTLAALARRLLDMSEDLTRQTEAEGAVRTLAEEDIRLMPLIEFAMAQVAAHLGPSRRAWRVDETFGQVRLFADRRALNQVLVNVLSGAAASTRDGDWIELSAESDAETWSIVVQDEGIGLPVAQNDAHPEESRGIGLRLTLARSLMQAHGGSLIVDSTERVGTRVRLGFPAARLLMNEAACALRETVG